MYFLKIGTATRLVVPTEMAMSTLMNKYQNRFTGFARGIIGTLHDRDESTNPGNVRAARIWELHKSIVNIVSRRSIIEPVSWPQSSSVSEVLITLELIEQQCSILVTLSGSKDSFDSQLAQVNESYNIVTKILMLLRVLMFICIFLSTLFSDIVSPG